MDSHIESSITQGEATGQQEISDAPFPTEVALPDLQSLPRELGVLLVSAGVLGFVLPGPGTPVIIAGGLVLWPKGFAKAEAWIRRRFPEVHRGGMSYLWRFLNDLERRYPGSLGGSSANASPGASAPIRSGQGP